jgi:hypothetical protein
VKIVTALYLITRNFVSWLNLDPFGLDVVRSISPGMLVLLCMGGVTAFSLLVLTERPHRGFSSRTGVPGKLACWGGRKAALRCPVLFRVEVKML